MDADDSSTLTSLHVVKRQLGGSLSEEHLGAVDNGHLESEQRELSTVRNPCDDLTQRKDSKIVN